MLKFIENKNYFYPLLLIFICVILFGLNIWGYPLIDVDEPRYMETAREMLFKPGDWITPHFNYLIRFDKPPLYYWLIASGFKLFGVHEWVGRAVSGMAATGIIMAVYCTVKRLLNKETAFIAGLIIASMAEVFLIGRWAVTDMTLTFWMCGTTLFLYLGLKQNQKYFILAGILAGFGMLTKGPIALLLPGFIAVVYTLLCERENWRWLISKYLLAGVVLSVIIALPWYWACYSANPDTFIPTFFGLHNITRFTQTVSGHTGGWGYYIPVVLIGAFPWSLCFAPLALGLKPLLLNKTFPEKTALLKYSLVWFIIVFLFFSVAQTKLLTYIMLCFPALGIICALLFEHWHYQETEHQISPDTKRILRLSILSVTLPYLFALGIVLIILFNTNLYPGLNDVLKYCNLPSITGAITSVFLVGVLTLIMTLKSGSRWLLGGLLIQAGLLYIVLATQIIPAIAHQKQDDLMNIVHQARQNNAILATWQSKRPSSVFYSEDKVYYLQLDCFHSNEAEDAESGAMESSATALMSKALPNHADTIYKPDRPVYVVLKTRVLQNFQKALGNPKHSRLLVHGVLTSAIALTTLPDKACLRKDINQ